MRGYGAILRLQNGEEFMDKYHPMKSLAPRDVTARAIYTEMTRRGEDFVYLDVRHKDPEQTRRHFPNIYEKCLSLGIDITRDDPRHPGGALLLRRGESRPQRRNLDPAALCAGRNLLHGTARRQPAGFELPRSKRSSMPTKPPNTPPRSSLRSKSRKAFPTGISKVPSTPKRC